MISPIHPHPAVDRPKFARMSSAFLLFLWSAAVLVVGWTGQLYILPYAAAMGVLLGLLHRLRPYREHLDRRTYDLIFMGYLWAVVGVRCRPFRWSPTVEYALNIAEHVGFALAVGSLMHLVLLLVLRWSPRNALMGAVIGFNLLGIGNELFQDWMGGDPIGLFDADAWKDIGANAAGSVLLMILLGGSTWVSNGKSVFMKHPSRPY